MSVDKGLDSDAAPAARQGLAPIAPDHAGRRMKGLDGLRAIAVVGVMACHFAEPYHFGGMVGVDVFFVISGYLMTGILLRERAKFGRMRYARFYTRRAIRLYPSLLLVTLGMLVPGIVLSASVGNFLTETVMALLYLTPITQLWLGDTGLWAHTWTLGLEEYFYLVWPVTLTAVISRRWGTTTRVWLLASVGALGYLGKFLLVADGHLFGSYLRAGGLLLGAALGLWFHHHPRAREPRWLGGVGLAGIAVAMTAGSVPATSPWQPFAYALAAGSTCALIPAVVSDESILARVLGWAPLAYVGLISYELYLWHLPIMRLGTLAGAGAGVDEWWWAAPLSFVLAAASYHVLKPVSDALKRRVAY